MEKTLRIAGAGMNNFVDDSPQSVKPQASSTFMISKTDLDLKDVDCTFQSPKHVSVGSVLSTTSSLGVIDLEKQSLFSDKDESVSKRLQESFKQNQNFIEEQRSLSLSRFKRRLDDIPVLKNLITENLKQDNEKVSDVSLQSVQSKNRDVPEINNYLKMYSISESSKSSSQIDLFDELSNVSSPLDSSFKCGKSAVLKLEADQKENKKEFDSIPVSPINISVNSENTDEREKKFTEFIKNKCYSPEEISNVLRNKLNIDLKDSSYENQLLMHVPEQTVNTDMNSNIALSSKIPKLFSLNNSQKNVETSKVEMFRDLNDKLDLQPDIQSVHCNSDVNIKNNVVDSTTFFNDSLEESRASSIASINQIAETLRRKSLMAEPRLAIEHLLSIGKSKVKSTVGTCFTLSSLSDKTNVCPVSSVPIITQDNFTSNISKESVRTPSTITCSAHDFSFDSMTGKVHAKNTYDTTFISARKLLESMNPKSSSISDDSFQSANEQIYPSRSHFCLVKTVSLLDIIDEDIQKNDMRQFWKLNPLSEASDNEIPNTQIKFTNIAETERKKVDELTRNSFLVSKNIDSKTNSQTEPVRRISLNQNLTSIINNITLSDTIEADSSSDLIHAGTLCLGTQVEIIMVIENPCTTALKYKISLKSILVNGEINLSALSVMLVSIYSDIILLPNAENEIKIMLSPLVPGKIDVVLEFISQEKKFMNITRQIRVTGEKPKLVIEYPDKSEINFDIIPESAVKNIPLVLRNEGLARLPLKFIVYEDNRLTFSAKTVIEPLDSFECDVRIVAHEMPESFSIENLSGELLIQLDTAEAEFLNRLTVLKKLYLLATFVKPTILINDGIPLKMHCNTSTKLTTEVIHVKNTSVIPLDITVQTIEVKKPEFTVDPQIFKLLPHTVKSLKILFQPNTKEKHREIDLNFVINGTNKVFSMKVTGIFENDAISSCITPLKCSTDTCITPNSNSSSGSSTGADGPMELDCTHNSISWGSIPLHTKNIQTITLRNRSTQKEKLILSISDTNGVFKFIENECYCRDLKLTLDPKESRRISVVFMPFSADQAVNGRILIIRRHSLESSVGDLQKRVIPLYGIGGKVKIILSGVFRDNESRLWITPESDSFETKFVVENSGNSVAFVRIVSEDSDDVITPEETILLPAESVEVNYSLYLNKDRIDSLCKQNPLKEVLLVNKIIILSGCESTRLRLKKLWMKYKEFENIQRIRDKIELLMDMNSHSKVQVDSLSDSQSVLNKLWYEGITEQVIGVLLPQQNLESACLDSTVVFKDLVDNVTLP